jgi:hypothetical protein
MLGEYSCVIYIQLQVRRDARGFLCVLYYTILALPVSGAICTHHQEHKLHSTAVGTCDCYGVLDYPTSNTPYLRLYSAVYAPADVCKYHPKHVEQI